jgi:hypothetical protein
MRNKIFEYLRKVKIVCKTAMLCEAEFKNALARKSGAQGVLFDEKN